MDKYCYNSPWCEPGEKCCCEAYAKYQEEEENNKIDAISDTTIRAVFCWTIAGLFGLMVLKELILT